MKKEEKRFDIQGMGETVSSHHRNDGTKEKPNCNKMAINESMSNIHNEISISLGRYIGDLKHGVPHGNGKYNGFFGNKYVGEFKNGEPDGSGKYTCSCGKTYTGDYSNEIRRNLSKFHHCGLLPQNINSNEKKCYGIIKDKEVIENICVSECDEDFSSYFQSDINFRNGNYSEPVDDMGLEIDTLYLYITEPELSELVSFLENNTNGDHKENWEKIVKYVQDKDFDEIPYEID